MIWQLIHDDGTVLMALEDPVHKFQDWIYSLPSGESITGRELTARRDLPGEAYYWPNKEFWLACWDRAKWVKQ